MRPQPAARAVCRELNRISSTKLAKAQRDSTPSVVCKATLPTGRFVVWGAIDWLPEPSLKQPRAEDGDEAIVGVEVALLSVDRISGLSLRRWLCSCGREEKSSAGAHCVLFGLVRRQE